ncbi:MAG: small subunit ribosomal protein [Acidimicrobiaceae bacterium]|jgi:small subunit ribosomal protein S18|nr:small subunit ribosomal protein [Acidimicrobiaceae bacterium]
MFCAQKIAWVDYKDTNLLRRFITDRGKIKARTNTGTCAQHQRDVALAIKTSRELALLPYLVRTLAADKGGPRRPRGPGGPGRPGERPAATEDAAAPAEADTSVAVGADGADFDADELV